MIKRTYFFSVKVAHNDNSGQYSCGNGIISTKGWRDDKKYILGEVRLLAVYELSGRLKRTIDQNDIEVIALNII